MLQKVWPYVADAVDQLVRDELPGEWGKANARNTPTVASPPRAQGAGAVVVLDH